MAERFKALVLKTRDGQLSVGSNPTPSAIRVITHFKVVAFLIKIVSSPLVTSCASLVFHYIVFAMNFRKLAHALVAVSIRCLTWFMKMAYYCYVSKVTEYHPFYVYLFIGLYVWFIPHHSYQYFSFCCIMISCWLCIFFLKARDIIANIKIFLSLFYIFNMINKFYVSWVNVIT